ncbi:MAG: helix-turn-helix domain-containing protein [Pseudomonadota bacterium]
MRARLIKEARRLFGEQGYASTSQTQICEHAGVSRGALNYHFGGKSELFEAVVSDVLTDFDMVDAAEDMDGALRRYFKIALDERVFRITVQDAPAVLGVTTWREMESAHFITPLAHQGVDPLTARMVYGALLEATIAAKSDLEPDRIVDRAIAVLSKWV